MHDQIQIIRKNLDSRVLVASHCEMQTNRAAIQNYLVVVPVELLFRDFAPQVLVIDQFL